MIKLSEDLRAWFGKGGKGGVGGGGWDRYNSSGDRVGKCGDAKEGDAYAACLSKEKARKLGKAGRAAFVKRKRAAQKKGGDAKKGGEQSKGQKPIKVKTENFADGKNPGRKGLSKRFGISQKMSIAQLEKIAKSSTGEKRKMAQWNLNMKRGRMKSEQTDNISEKWSARYKKSINCNNPKGFSQRAHCQGRKKRNKMKNENLDPNTFKDTGKSAPYGSGYSKIKELEEKLNLFLEKNVPTNPSKWAYYKGQAKKKFDVYPSAYANAWAAKQYKAAGGKWRKEESVLKLEAGLLNVSKPYEFQVGDMVRNINPTCTHYKSVGKVVYVHDDGDITYQVNNQGATYTPGDELTKSPDQLIKVFMHTPRPGYGSFSNE